VDQESFSLWLEEVLEARARAAGSDGPQVEMRAVAGPGGLLVAGSAGMAKKPAGDRHFFHNAVRWLRRTLGRQPAWTLIDYWNQK